MERSKAGGRDPVRVRGAYTQGLPYRGEEAHQGHDEDVGRPHAPLLVQLSALNSGLVARSGKQDQKCNFWIGLFNDLRGMPDA